MSAAFALVFLVLGAASFVAWIVTLRSRLLRHVANGALVLALSFFLFAIAAAWQAAKAQGHAEHHDWYKDLRSNGGGSCCNAATPDGQGDCRPVSARPRDNGNGWEAFYNGQWNRIPESAVLPDEFNKVPLYAHILRAGGLHPLLPERRRRELGKNRASWARREAAHFAEDGEVAYLARDGDVACPSLRTERSPPGPRHLCFAPVLASAGAGAFFVSGFRQPRTGRRR